MSLCLSKSDTLGSGSKLNMPPGVPSATRLLESLEGYLLGVVKFGFSVWGAETIGGGSEMDDKGNYKEGGVCG